MPAILAHNDLLLQPIITQLSRWHPTLSWREEAERQVGADAAARCDLASLLEQRRYFLRSQVSLDLGDRCLKLASFREGGS